MDKSKKEWIAPSIEEMDDDTYADLIADAYGAVGLIPSMVTRRQFDAARALGIKDPFEDCAPDDRARAYKRLGIDPP